jgi:hypothetical protein
MKQFIKEHPWRLEIVPFIIMISAIILPLLLRQAYIRSFLESSNEFKQFSYVDAAQRWLVVYLSQLDVVLGLWVIGILGNHIWIGLERRKSFNFFAPFWSILMAYMIISIDYPRLSPAWLIIASLVIASQTSLEFTRWFVPKKKPQELLQNIKAAHFDESFSYKETFTIWWWAIPMVYIAMNFILWGWLYNSITLYCLAGGVIITILFTRVTFTVNSEKITARFTFRRISINMSEIRRCRLDDFNPKNTSFGGMKYYGAKFFVPYGKSGTCLEVIASNSDAYVFGMDNPEIAHKLIDTAISARQQE